MFRSCLDNNVHICLFLIDTQLTSLDFSMPSMNSVSLFLESICPESDPTCHIRRCRLLDSYESAWAASYNDDNRSTSTTFHGELHFMEERSKYFLFCLVPKDWIISSGTGPGSNAKLYNQLQQCCLRLVLSKGLGAIVGHGEFIDKD